MYWGAGGPAWLGRRLYEAEAAGSNPARPTFRVWFFLFGCGVLWFGVFFGVVFGFGLFFGFFVVWVCL